MTANYRLLRNGNPVAWFTHADQVECILHNAPSPAWSVEFTAITGKLVPMELSESGWLQFTAEAQAILEY
mgnify:CR=1 FL=1